MIAHLNQIRKPEPVSGVQKIGYPLITLALGVMLGILSKALDETASNLLPAFLEQLDLRNFLSRMGIWMFLGICISLYAKTPQRAAINTLLFFTGMVSSYYLYTIAVAGFFSKSYTMIWIAMTLLSPLLGAVCWYAKGTQLVSICISSLLFMMMTRQAFHVGVWYFDVSHFLELILWAATIFILYQSPVQIARVLGIGGLLFFITSQVNLFWGML